MLQAAEGQPQANKGTDIDEDEAMRPTKKVRPFPQQELLFYLTPRTFWRVSLLGCLYRPITRIPISCGGCIDPATQGISLDQQLSVQKLPLKSSFPGCNWQVRGADGTPRAARAPSLGTVIAAVEERATRQGNSTIDAAVGSAPTTVEDCLQSSSFGNVRKVQLPGYMYDGSL